ncbi:hypothetical protein AVEN_22324-1 [Araneus ventricosus]|uniref:Uncharacterized protein n=1 Tax=Araneus ventricosus TaxID=182803 RepID=A0A4Y2HC88_ARAVE|nr:hypothetical protein AVEN_22324-1 [Araneus ventricosus]
MCLTGRKQVTRKLDHPALPKHPGRLNTAAVIASSIEALVLIANHLAMARPLPKEVHTITGGGAQTPPLLYPQGRRVPAYLSGSNSYAWE